MLSGQSDGSLKWTFQFTTGTIFLSSPAVGADGTIYFGRGSSQPFGNARVFALNPATGIPKWTFQVSDWVDSSPAVGVDGTVYVGSWDSSLYAVSAEGVFRWSFATAGPILSSPAIGEDGTVYVGSGDGNLHAINSDGTERWVYPTLDWVDSSPAVGADGTVYVGSWDNSLYAVSAEGVFRWSFATEGPIISSPAIGEDGTVYVGSDDASIYAIGIDGELVWKYMTGDSIESSPAIGEDGTVYVGSLDGYLYAIGLDGTLRWRYLVGFAIVSSPAVRSDGSVVFGAGDNKITCLSSTGNFVWAVETGDWVDSSPAIGEDGTIYVGSFDNNLYAIAGDHVLANSPWPEFHLNSARTGTVQSSVPIIAVQPFSLTAAPGDRIILQVIPIEPAGTAIQWVKDGTEITGETNSVLDLGAVTLADIGSYRAYVSNGVGGAWSDFANLQVVPGVDSRLSNISTRGRVEGILQIMIPGFVVEGSGVFSTLIRGVGPTLGTFGVQGFLPDPNLEVLDGFATLATNDDWGDAPNVGEIIVASSNVGAFELDAGSLDSAVLIDLGTGPYTAKVTGVNGSAGISLVEVYEVTDGSTQTRLVNISNRGSVGTGSAVMIPGFVIDGTSARAVLIRGVGPSLAAFGVSDFLEDSRLVLYQGTDVINTNDDWQDAPNANEIVAGAVAVGAFPLSEGSKDAAVLTVLPPGTYTAAVEGVDGGVGTALVEVYQLP